MADATAQLPYQIQRWLAAHSLFHPKAPTLIAVSGGADSVAALHALRALDYTGLEIAHFDHQTRDGDSARDAGFVAAAAKSLGLPFHLHSQPVAQEARATGRSFEEYAREVRYKFLLATARRRGCRYLVTGHHADDQAETVLLRLLRGAAPSGLAGIPVARRMGGVAIVRPLLCCTRAQIEQFLCEHKIEYVTDHTNADVHYPRNRIRHELLPLLARDYNPDVSATLTRYAEIQRDEHEYLNAQARIWLQAVTRLDDTLDREAFITGPIALQRRALAMLARDAWAEASFTRIEGARHFFASGSTGAAFDFGGGLVFRLSRKGIEILGDDTADMEAPRILPVPGFVEVSGLRITTRRLSALPDTPLHEYCNAGRQVFDADALGDELLLRQRARGDRFSPLGLDGTKKLKDYCNDLGLTMKQRRRLWLVISQERIAWVMGHAVDARFAVTPETKNFAEIEVGHATE